MLDGFVRIYAGKLYTAYCEAVGGKAHNGDPLPDWDTFLKDPAKKVQSDAWIAVAQFALDGLQITIGYDEMV